MTIFSKIQNNYNIKIKSFFKFESTSDSTSDSTVYFKVASSRPQCGRCGSTGGCSC